MATQFTDRTVRADGQWVKITRDNKKRTFTFARGYDDEFRAREMDTLPFKYIPNWAEAVERAHRLISYWK